MNADPHVNLLGCAFVGIVDLEVVLNLLGTLHGMHHRGKVHQEAIPDGFDNLPMMFTDGLLNDLVMSVQQPEGAGFVAAHLTAKAHDVGEHDRGQAAGLRVPHTTRVVPPGSDYTTPCLAVYRARRLFARG